MINGCHWKRLTTQMGDAMTREHVVGVVVGLTTAALAINHSVPEFFTAEHAQALYETLPPGRLLSRYLLDTEAAARGPVLDPRDWSSRQGY